MDTLTPKDHAEEVALFRSTVIGSLLRRELDRGELRAELQTLSQTRLRPPESEHTKCFSIPTLERWYYRYRKQGLSGLRPKPRSDRGRAHQLTEALRTLLCDIRREYPFATVPLILRTLITDGRMEKATVSASTVRRLFVEKGLDRVPLRDGAGRKTRLKWQAERPGALWHGDVCYGPALKIGSESKPLRIHALLDDASRYIVAIEAHHTEREVDMLGLFVRALRRHGAPDALYLDNGSTYIGNALRVGCERLDVTLLHARPYDAPARGKMERFWRTLREGCLDFLGSLTSLHDVNVRLWAFVDAHYHVAPHAAHYGRTPASVFGDNEAERTADSLTEPRLREALTVRERRRVRRDTTLSIEGTLWELDQGFLAGRVVTIGRSLLDASEPPWVEHEGQRLVLHAVDPIKNAHRKRPPRREPSEEVPSRHVPFDPPGALLDKVVRRTRSPKGGAK